MRNYRCLGSCMQSRPWGTSTPLGTARRSSQVGRPEAATLAAPRGWVSPVRAPPSPQCKDTLNKSRKQIMMPFCFALHFSSTDNLEVMGLSKRGAKDNHCGSMEFLCLCNGQEKLAPPSMQTKSSPYVSCMHAVDELLDCVQFSLTN
jgi:hypothetical protein